MEFTIEQKQKWEKWLSELPENIKKVAEQIVPWKMYRHKMTKDDIGNRYIPRSYEEEDGIITITCEKVNEWMPSLGGYDVFGMSADDLEEAD